MKGNRIHLTVTDWMIGKMNTIYSFMYRHDETRLPDFARDLGVSVDQLKLLLGRVDRRGDIIPIREDFCTFAGVNESWLIFGRPEGFFKSGRVKLDWLSQPAADGLVDIFLLNRTPRRIIKMSPEIEEYRLGDAILAKYLDDIHIRLGNTE